MTRYPHKQRAAGFPQLVAHRGYAYRYPENSLEALRAALDAGVPFIEFDVQLSKDRVPVLLHDSSLARTAGLPRRVFEMSFAELLSIEVNETLRLGNTFQGIRIPALAQALSLLGEYPGAQAFVEVKRASLGRFGLTEVMKIVLGELRPHFEKCVLTSFDAQALAHARDAGAPRIAWVLEEYDLSARRQAQALGPDYLFCDYLKLPEGVDELWAGAWAWVLYEITDPQPAIQWYRRGAELIETMQVGEMLRDPRLAKGRLGC